MLRAGRYSGWGLMNSPGSAPPFRGLHQVGPSSHMGPEGLEGSTMLTVPCASAFRDAAAHENYDNLLESAREKCMLKAHWRRPNGSLDVEATSPEVGYVGGATRPSRSAGLPSKLLHAAQAAALSLALTACATPSEPRIVVKEVLTPVAVKCAAPIPPPKVHVDSDSALKAAPDLFTRVQLLLAARFDRMAELAEVRAAVAGC